jgi:hypothetical protein
VILGSVDYYAQNYTAPGERENAIGATAAHELLHAITGLPDETIATAPSSPDILTADLALRLGLQDGVMFSLTNSVPSLYSKLSIAQAERLYSVCMKLQAPQSGGARGGGGFSVGGFDDNWWFWFLELKNSTWVPEQDPPGEVIQTGGHN